MNRDKAGFWLIVLAIVGLVITGLDWLFAKPGSALATVMDVAGLIWGALLAYGAVDLRRRAFAKIADDQLRRRFATMTDNQLRKFYKSLEADDPRGDITAVECERRNMHL